MLTRNFAAIRASFSGLAAKEDVAAVIRHHRIQASPGYRDAADYVFDELKSAGIDAAIETYPANYETKFWNSSSFQEWTAVSATLDLVDASDAARRLADYREMKLSLIQRSIPFHGEVEIVLLEDGLQASEYDGLDVAGKVVLSSAPAEQVRQLAVEQYGAAGILFDGMAEAQPVRQPMDIPDARQYTSFWWTGRPEEKQCFGFVLSPRQGQWLRKLVMARQKAGLPPVKAAVEIDTRFHDGQIEVVTAAIPGTSKKHESVIIVSHLCHPQPSANDNATGVAANLEAARTLQKLISSGALPRPHRTIRFLWMPEMTGSYAYLSRHEDDIPNIIAGLNLDMVGEDQTKTGSVLVLERPPEASASFAPDLLQRLRQELFDDANLLSGIGSFATFRYTTTPFSGGSDHYIFSDPTVGIPMPMLIQWPDKFYHTSADTLDKVSSRSLERSGSLAAAYAYFIAAAGKKETNWLAHEMLAQFQARLSELTQTHITNLFEHGSDGSSGRFRRHLDYMVERFHQALQTLDRLWPGMGEHLGEFQTAADQQVSEAFDRLSRLSLELEIDGKPVQQLNQWERQAASLIPVRNYRGPGVSIGGLASLTQEERTLWNELLRTRPAGARTLPVLAEYWADGRRTILEIIELVELETGIRDAELLLGKFELLQKLGLVELLEN